MDQLQIEFRARNTDPATSHMAAATVHYFAGGHHLRILGALQQYGPMSAHEIATKTGLSMVQVDRRVVELGRSGQAHVVPNVTRPSQSGRACRVWAV